MITVAKAGMTPADEKELQQNLQTMLNNVSVPNLMYLGRLAKKKGKDMDKTIGRLQKLQKA